MTKSKISVNINSIYDRWFGKILIFTFTITVSSANVIKEVHLYDQDLYDIKNNTDVKKLFNGHYDTGIKLSYNRCLNLCQQMEADNILYRLNRLLLINVNYIL